MAYLDVSPMTLALRTMPEEFEMSRGWLKHLPSRHYFNFDDQGRVKLQAHCNCVQLTIRPEQERELFDAFQAWRSDYWTPVEINREFASHFRPRSALRRWLIALTAALHRRLTCVDDGAPEREDVLVPAE
jgi:hypothetical protein